MKTIIPNIKFDVSGISNLFNLNKNQTKEFMRTVLADISEAVIYSWREEAHKSLGSTRNQYIRGIQQPVINNNISIIELIGTLPNMIESGANALDMKIGFSKSFKVVMKKGGGWYLTIPFRWAASESLGENEAFSNKLPGEVHSLAKDLTPSKNVITETGEKKIKYGSSIQEENLPKKYQGRKTREDIKDVEGNVVYGAYKHKTNIYQGIIKTQETYEKATQNTYFSFRRVSDKSDPLSWIHPGFIAKNFADKAISKLDLDSVVNNSANIYIENLGL